MEEVKPKYQVGDTIRIKYGSPVWIFKKEWELRCKAYNVLKVKPDHLLYEDDKIFRYDISPELSGKLATIVEVVVVQNLVKYKLKGVNKVAWYTEDQLEKI